MVNTTAQFSSGSVSPTDLVQRQRDFFGLGYTRSLDYRLRRLQELRRALVEEEPRLREALRLDLGKSDFDVLSSEVGFCLAELDVAIKNLPKWMRSQKVGLPLTLLPGSGRIVPQPLGVVLILGAWNYPVQLTLVPLIGAIAAGNCAIIKPSEVAPHSSRAIAELLQRTFDPMYVTTVEGGANTSQALLEERFDHIFYTGGPTIAKVVMGMAARHLTPVTLELGGKNPCIVDETADIEVTARRVVWGKYFNAGQTCLAVDHLWVHSSIKSQLLQQIARTIAEFYGEAPHQSADYGRIVNQYHCDRLQRLIVSGGRIVVGGQLDPTQRYLSPTVIDEVPLNSPLMQEEIFGPVLPIVPYDDLDSVLRYVNQQPSPLAVYLFSTDGDRHQQFTQETQSGAIVINDAVVQAAAPNLPFGGVGNSGMGKYHGKASFDCFTHSKTVLKRPFWLDVNVRYAPYNSQKLNLLRRLMRI
ncbi:MAG: aldehyde dehydrogenase family protein [Cyanobacteria bacterium P01_F01_bin.153]